MTLFDSSLPMVLALAVLLDMILGDPPGWPHPVRLMGGVIGRYDRLISHLNLSPGRLFVEGLVVALGVPLLAWSAGVLLMAGATWVHPWLGFAVSVYLAYTCIALTGLGRSVEKVATALTSCNLPVARRAVSRIVGRDTDEMSASQVAGAAMESSAENCSDGVIAPLFYLAIGGPALGLAYKAINTADSMIGYKDGHHLYFGRAAARLDDVVNWIPARVTCLLIMLSAWLLGHSAKGAWRVSFRDAPRHESPNAGWPEAAAAGALRVRLGGDASYGGKLRKRPVLGEGGRTPHTLHLLQVARLTRMAGVLGAVLAVGLGALLSLGFA